MAKQETGSDSPSLGAQAEFYDKRWTETEYRLGDDEQPINLRRLDQIFDCMRIIEKRSPMSGRTILDLGCGSGWLGSKLRRWGKVSGIDLSPKGVERGRTLYPDITFYVGNLIDFRPKGPYDVVVSSEVIEHVADRAAFMKTIFACVKPGGYCIITCPNPKVRKAWETNGFALQPIEEWPSVAELRSLFSGEFDVVRHHTFEFDFAYTGIFRITSAPKLLTLVKVLKLTQVYDSLRRSFDIGFHQILLAQRRS
jgi:SAM-dependent methyltransferase